MTVDPKSTRWFYDSAPWRLLRDNFRKKMRRFGCAHCHKPFLPKEHIHVDHIVPIRENWNRRLDWSNLRLLHKGCHSSITHSKKPPVRDDGFPADGSWDE